MRSVCLSNTAVHSLGCHPCTCMLLNLRFQADSNPSLSAIQSGLQRISALQRLKSYKFPAFLQILPLSWTAENGLHWTRNRHFAPFSLDGQRAVQLEPNLRAGRLSVNFRFARNPSGCREMGSLGRALMSQVASFWDCPKDPMVNSPPGLAVSILPANSPPLLWFSALSGYRPP